MKAKEFIPVSKPRNFVAKNAQSSGAGRHQDSSKKKDQEQGKVKHKKDLVPMEDQGVAEGSESYPEVLYHGSTQEINGPLTPRQAGDIGGAKKSNKNAIYATDDPNFAIAYSLAERGSDTGTFGWKKDPHLIFFGGKIRHGQNVYIHILPTRDEQGRPLFVRGAADAEWYSRPGVKEITPTEVKPLPVDQYLHLLRKPTPEEQKIFQTNKAKANKAKQGVAEAVPTIRGTPKAQPSADYTGKDAAEYARAELDHTFNTGMLYSRNTFSKPKSKSKKPVKEAGSPAQQAAIAVAKKKEQGVEEGWSDAYVSRRTGRPRTPYSVYIKGKKWKDFENDDHARAVMDKLKAKFKADGRDPSVITIAPTEIITGEATALEKFRKAADEREKKHDAAEKEMRARHARGEEDMKGSIDRLEKHVNNK